MAEEAAPLRRGWTTGACAAAAAMAAARALFAGDRPASVTIDLPGGQQPSFTIAHEADGSGWAEAGVIKDAGDDPDVTHGALVIARIAAGSPGSGIAFRAGLGVGTVTRPGLPLPPGEPAINPGPRALITAALAKAGAPTDVVVTVSIPGGEEIATRTLNGRLGIVGGLSVLGTTGIVIPFSCAAWIDTIHRSIDVARAANLTHLAASTGTTSERAAQARWNLTDLALIEMGDFVGGTLKYLRRHPVPRVTIAGGFAKMTKLGQGLLDLHSKRGAVDLDWLAGISARLGASTTLQAEIRGANSALDALTLCTQGGIAIGAAVAEAARDRAAAVVLGSGVAVDVAIFHRDGQLLAATLPD